MFGLSVYMVTCSGDVRLFGLCVRCETKSVTFLQLQQSGFKMCFTRLNLSKAHRYVVKINHVAWRMKKAKESALVSVLHCIFS